MNLPQSLENFDALSTLLKFGFPGLAVILLYKAQSIISQQTKLLRDFDPGKLTNELSHKTYTYLIRNASVNARIYFGLTVVTLALAACMYWLDPANDLRLSMHPKAEKIWPRVSHQNVPLAFDDNGCQTILIRKSQTLEINNDFVIQDYDQKLQNMIQKEGKNVRSAGLGIKIGQEGK